VLAVICILTPARFVAALRSVMSTGETCVGTLSPVVTLTHVAPASLIG
jgi:hypothetical protein